MPRVSPKHVVSTTVPVKPVAVNTIAMETLSARYHRRATSSGFEGKFPLPKKPKVDIPVFKVM